MDKKTLKNALLLAAPHTWTASVIPALFSAALGRHFAGGVRVDIAICTALVAVSMQSAVNAFDDYSDFKKGTDTPENSPDAYDAVLVYGMKPQDALLSGASFLLIAAAAGAYAVMHCGVIPLILGMVGGITVLCYAFGKIPLSYLPLGELVSGFVMGGLIPLAGSYMQCGALHWEALLYSLPVMIGIALIMFTNNACDIPRDTAAGRKTLCCILGESKAGKGYRALLLIWAGTPVLILAVLGNAQQLSIYLLSLPAAWPMLTRQRGRRLGPETRKDAMGGITTLNTMMGLGYLFAVAMGG